MATGLISVIVYCSEFFLYSKRCSVIMASFMHIYNRGLVRFVWWPYFGQHVLKACKREQENDNNVFSNTYNYMYTNIHVRTPVAS